MKKIFICALALLAALPLVVNAASFTDAVRAAGYRTLTIEDAKKGIAARRARAANLQSATTPDLNFYRLISFVTATPSPNVDPNSQNLDPLLVNSWGLAITEENNLIVANNGTNKSTYYSPIGGGWPFNPGTIAPQRPTLFVNIGSDPTGVVVNSSDDSFKFKVHGQKKKPAEFIYCTEQGKILAYNQHVDPLNGVVVASRHQAVYKGLVIAKKDNGKHYLYAADFHHNRIDMFNDDFEWVKSFTDTGLPNGYAPFNIETFGGKLYVTYAKQLAPAKVDPELGAGKGYVDIFDTNGHFIKRLISQGNLNAPWGLAMAPGNYGQFSNALLVGNFGDGFINAYNPNNGNFIGKLFDNTAAAIQIPNLWALKFNNKINPVRPQLYFTAGLVGGTDGQVGCIQYAANDLSPN